MRSALLQSRTFSHLAAVLLAGGFACLAGCSQQELKWSPGPPDEEGFYTLFDGTSTDGWAVYHHQPDELRPDAFFVEDGVIGCRGYGYHWLRYEAREFQDFILKLDYKVEEDTNSGVCLRTARKGHPAFTGFEVQIAEDYDLEPHKHRTGAIYDVVTPMFNASKPAGEWNHLEINCEGRNVQVVLNDRKVIDVDFSQLTEPIGKFKTPYAELPLSGYVCLQDHATPIWFRNVKIKPLNEEKDKM
jgi:hypothetical protein